MCFKTILVPVSDTESGQAALETALMVGRDFAGHVRVLHVRSDPAAAVPLVGEGMSGAMVEEMMTTAEQQAAERAAAVRRLVDERLGHLGIPTVTGPGRDEVTASFMDVTGHEEELVALQGRLSDLVVVGRPLADRELPSSMTLNAALMESGRPMLMAPPMAPLGLGKRVVIAWNGSAEAARAVRFALPFLKKAEAVTIITAQEEEGVAPGDAAAYLLWHGLSAQCSSFEARGNVGEALLLKVAELGGDLLVMGAYSHSRLRQLILGGVTRHVVHEATVPVLLSH